ncbi:hypothetical protein ElyMa_001783200 [Elysia marginata]|uniref:Uncharacterized protein n=1 Tax=Elysia marginata TaxID=1093978 RepID=A0AAV4EES0_9GAST|nr:hypothetical protein ElyMa_001783200 [Elysia marginata]
MIQTAVNSQFEVKIEWSGLYNTRRLQNSLHGGEHHYRGFGVIFVPETSKAIIGFWIVGNRGIIVKLQGKSFDVGPLQKYTLTADKDKEMAKSSAKQS